MNAKPVLRVALASLILCRAGAEERTPGSATSRPLFSLEEAFASKLDVWGEAAMIQPNGPSHEFFESALPPLRYVNADFRFYPIVLSAPQATVKARLISNGSGINLEGGARAWNNPGIPVRFRVGPDEFLFGAEVERVSHPTLADGWLPIPEIRYLHPTPIHAGGAVPLSVQRPSVLPETYRLEAFAATEPELAAHGMVLVKFDLCQGTNGQVALDFGSKASLRFDQGAIRDEQDRVLAVCDPAWKWDRRLAVARLTSGDCATAAIATVPLHKPGRTQAGADFYSAQRETCVRTWRTILARGMNVQVPERRINDAWRHLVCQNFELINGDRIHYSSGNQYDKLYESEGSDAALALMTWGYETDMRRLMVPLLEFTRKGLEFHQAGFKLNNVCRYFWQTRDAAAVSELRPRWEAEARRLVDNRTSEHGLFPKEQYCGDISTFVFSLNANSKAWRAIRDLGAMLDELGQKSEAARYGKVAAEYRQAVLAALARNIRRETTPPFIPVALFGDEPVHDPILHSRIGSYWNIIIGYTIGSGIFPPGSEEETWLPKFQEQHGGLFMGMLRAGGESPVFWNSPCRVNPLYGTRYVLNTLQRDDPERALVSLYGMLAQGFTRNTFVSGEGCSLGPLDAGGRFFYCPPNSAANAHLLSMLRYSLVQDWDLDDDGKPDTLRLLFATPKRWLEHGKTIRIERAPTAFGPLSLSVRSRLSQGEVLVELDPATRNPPQRSLLRIRVPDGWKVQPATAADRQVPVDDKGTMDISGIRERTTISFGVTRRQP